MRLSVVIPALNEERHLGQLLSDIQRQSHRPDEVIVVDAASCDATVRIAKQSSTAVLHGEPPVARGRNVGGYSAKGDLIFFLDADTRLPEAFFEHFVSEVERRCLDIACPRYLPHDPTPTIRAIHAFWDVVLRVFERTLPSGAGHCIALRSKLFRESRGFNPSLKFDDIELWCGASRRGGASATWARASSSPIGATGKRGSSVRSSYTCSWRSRSLSASLSGPTAWPTSSETMTTRLENDPAAG